MVDAQTDLIASGYDAVYTAMPNSPTLLRLWREHALGDGYPEGFESISFLRLADMRRMAGELKLAAGGRLVDLGCGMGGPGLWIARETGARLTGIDRSNVAVAQAAARAAARGLAESADFAAGSFAQTGLERASADGAMSIDALQYAPDKREAFAEAARILRPGARFVFRAFELDPGRAAELPVLGLDPVDDYQPLLSSTGFSVLVYEATEVWPKRVTAAYEAILAAEKTLAQEMGEQAWLALSLEVSLTLQRQPYRRHVLAVAMRA
jgi:ubiquinone/menaquinone biosynthesis C-methylase UbiE